MSKFSKYIISLILVLSCAVSCKKDAEEVNTEPQLRAAFLEMDTPSVVLNGKTLREFDKSRDQVIFNDSRTLYSIADYAYTDYVTVSINGDLVEGKTLTASYRLINSESLSNGNTQVEVLRAKDDTFWLWSSEKRLGIVARFF